MAFSPDAAFSYLRRAHDQQRLAHAYLISGAPGTGKRRLASRLANLVNRTEDQDIFVAGTADVYVAQPESKSRRIVVDQIRGLEHSLQMRASDGRRKVAIVSDADRLQTQAANAFLKTLEEPPNDSLLLLLSTLPEALPDTILSRCIPIPLAAPEFTVPSAQEEELVELLRAIKPAEAGGVQSAYRLAQAFQRLLAGVRESIQTENAAALKREEVRYKNTTDGAWLDDREDHFKALTESMYLQRRAQLVEVVFCWWSDVLRASTGIDRHELPAAAAETRAMAATLRMPQILARLRRVEELRDQLGRNIQEALAVEVAFLSIFRF
ncbi:MAG: DNA polymerase III delta prime subunit [uncultured Chthoniobacterales bacterium]|uniref:DNA polymerase III delta prime subunit n=1 Tax=uncultured Chthoniobacterales bacterium TaxID=1836801 RepID=A0A6J4HT63_9BACT|nr:MAG: DNA polymerase III delta prime subunit [uncultured Chthoniobacterales bacterium]